MSILNKSFNIFNSECVKIASIQIDHHQGEDTASIKVDSENGVNTSNISFAGAETMSCIVSRVRNGFVQALVANGFGEKYIDSVMSFDIYNRANDCDDLIITVT